MISQCNSNCAHLLPPLPPPPPPLKGLPSFTEFYRVLPSFLPSTWTEWPPWKASCPRSCPFPPFFACMQIRSWHFTKRVISIESFAYLVEGEARVCYRVVTSFGPFDDVPCGVFFFGWMDVPSFLFLCTEFCVLILRDFFRNDVTAASSARGIGRRLPPGARSPHYLVLPSFT